MRSKQAPEDHGALTVAAGMVIAVAALLTTTCSRRALESGSAVDASQVGPGAAGVAGARGGVPGPGSAATGGAAGGGGAAAAAGGGSAGDGGTAAPGGGGAGGGCAAASCGPEPPPGICNDGPGPAFNCLRDADGVCRWYLGSCAVDCRGIRGDAIACGKTADCVYLIPGCAGPTIPTAGCYDRGDVGPTCHPFACVAPKTCQSVVVDSCTLASGRLEAASCADAVCRDRTVIICATPTGGAGGAGSGSGSCAEVTTLAACEARGDCHAVFFDPHVPCDCPALGCCAGFLRCADGDQANCHAVPTCDGPEPYCEGPYVIAYTDTCYEGCVQAKDCAPVCTPGADQTCNDDPRISSIRGICVSPGRCVCKPGSSVSLSTGRCL